MLSKIRFEYVFAIIVVVILSAALFIFKGNERVVTTIITALVGSLSAITTFFFTKHVPKQEQTENKPPQVINPSGRITNDIK